MTLDPKVLKAAHKACPGTFLTDDRIIAVIEAAFNAADLVPRSDLLFQQKLRFDMLQERDEARREAERASTLADIVCDERDLAYKVAKEQSKQLAALRAVITQFPYSLKAGNKAAWDKLNAALTDTASAAAQYQRVPEGYVVVPNLERMEEWARKLNTAAPKVDEPEGE